MKQAPPKEEAEKKKQTEVKKVRPKETAKEREKSKSADAFALNGKTRNDAGFSLAQHAAQLSRTQMVRGADAALVAQARRLSPQVLVLLY